MPSHNPIPLATDNVQCIKCLKPISENQSYSQCDTCIQYIHSSCMNSKKSKKQSLPNNRQFTCDKCSQCPICVRKVAINHKAILCDLCNLGYTSNAINFILMTSWMCARNGYIQISIKLLSFLFDCWKFALATSIIDE